ncbi:MAG: transcriptional repressor [Tannerella sp.]|jgi:Fur family ferric uptake transcriptional regulator|nr:transcriptional repressor [Tannerella sp.]
MNTPAMYSEKLQKTFSEYLKNKNLRHTVERDAIFNKVCSTIEPFTMDMIWQQLENENFHVSRSSIYNTIELLIDSKIVVRHSFSYTNVLYELKYISDEHHHIVCTTCGVVKSVRIGKLSNILTGFKIPKFTPEYYALNIYGLCSKCKYRQIREEVKKRKQNDKS